MGGWQPLWYWLFCKNWHSEKNTFWDWNLACTHSKLVLRLYESLPGYRILLCHHPEYYPRYLMGRKIDLILSGHAHGGQWRIGQQGIYAPGQGLLPRLTSGVVDRKLVISRGLFNRAMIPRVNNPTEIVYVLSWKRMEPGSIWSSSGGIRRKERRNIALFLLLE